MLVVWCSQGFPLPKGFSENPELNAPQKEGAEAFLKKSKNTTTGKVEYSAGPRATLSRDTITSEAFVKSL